MVTKIFELFESLKADHLGRKTQALAKSTRRGKVAKAFTSQPMPRGVGNSSKGLQLAAGNFLIGGRLVKEPDEMIWDVEKDHIEFQTKAHGFFWLDDLAANGSRTCLDTAKVWFYDWLSRYGDGENLAWTPELAGARIIRLVNHAVVLLNGANATQSKQYFASISHHARFLKKTWGGAPEGLSRFQALVGYVYSALALEKFTKDLKSSLAKLTKECEAYIGEDGDIPSRNPEELLEIFTLLVWVDQGITTAGLTPDRSLLTAIERIAPLIRTLRMGDGRLVEFHGGEASDADRIDNILQDGGVRGTSTLEDVMGYSRMSKGTSVLIADMAHAPEIDDTYDCALALEFSSNNFGLFKSTGAGRNLSVGWQAAAKTAAAFSVVSIQPFSSEASMRQRKQVASISDDVEVTLTRSERNERGVDLLSGQHTGYKAEFGLTYNRSLEMSSNGRALSGTDRLYCAHKKDEAVFDTAILHQVTQSIPFVSRFRLGVDVDAELDLGGTAVSLKLPNDEVWVFKASGGKLSLEGSAYFSDDRLKPRATKQIVVTSYAVNYEGAVSWVVTRL